MKKLSVVFVVVFLAGIILSFSSQDDPLKKILIQLEKYRTDYVQEKVHLHLDKPYYAIGDNIWFKAYVVVAEEHRLSNLSKILYVELINDKDSVKQSLRLPVDAGLAWGDFTLSDTLREGNYRIRAYTTWMRNFGEDYFFDKTISIGNSISNTVLANTTYSFSKVGNNQQVQADIAYSNLRGEPLANKEVTYNIQLNFRNISKGQGVTDGQGRITINFTNSQPFILKSGKILTTIRTDANRLIAKTIPIKATSGDVDLQFFPESGNLISGIRSRVAFKAVGANGLGVEVSGQVKDQDGTFICELKSEHAGMGLLSFLPDANHKYTALIKFEDGSEKEYPLPKVLPLGYVLSANTLNSDTLTIKVAVSPSLPSKGELKVLAQSNGVVHYASKSALEKSVFMAKVDKRRFPDGILQLTLFSAENEPVAERLVFINNMKPLDIQVSSDTLESGKRQKVKLTLNTKDSEGKPSRGSFSMSVIDESKVTLSEENEKTIISDLLLTSDLKGYIEQPNYYFADTASERARHLDILLLTQGWRRFIWKNLLTNTFPAITYAPETTIRISGTVTTNNGKPVVGGKVTLFSSSGDSFLMDTVTNAEGRFEFSDMFHNDSTKFVIQARNENGRKNVQVELDGIPPQLVTKNKNSADLETNVNGSLITYLMNSKRQYEELKRYGLVNRSILLSEVKIVETRPLVKNSSNLNGAGNADHVISEKDLKYAIDLPTYLQGRVPGLVIRNGIAFSSRSMYSSFSGLVPMQLVIDGMLVSPEFLRSINPHDVESIEILKSAANTAIYGLRGGGGVLVVNTKRGERNLSYRSYAPGIVSFKPQGLYKSRIFYSPNYDDPKINTKMADLRSTIFWHPNIVTDINGKASVEYFNSDGTGSFAVIVEGINLQGHIGRTIYRYQVN